MRVSVIALLRISGFKLLSGESIYKWFHAMTNWMNLIDWDWFFYLRIYNECFWWMNLFHVRTLINLLMQLLWIWNVGQLKVKEFLFPGWPAFQLFKIPWPFQKIFSDFGVRVKLLNITIDIHISLFLCKTSAIFISRK